MSNEETPPPGPPQAFYFPSCAPTDGPAFEVFIPSEPSTCDDVLHINYSQPWEQTFTRVYVYGSFTLEAQSSYQFGDAFNGEPGYSTGGWAGRCEKGATACTSAKSGTLRIFYPESDLLPYGDLTILFQDNSTLIAQYALNACMRPQTSFCG